MKLLNLIFLIPFFVLIGCDSDPCSDTECFNDGYCEEGDCICPPGYSGNQCQTYDACFSVTCENGGTCSNGQCNCTDRYKGSDCSQQVTPNSIIIKSITVTQFPPLDNGLDWDGGLCGGANPDIFLEVYSGSQMIGSTDYFSDVIPGTSFQYVFSGLSVDNVLNEVAVVLYDNDTGVCAPSDRMGGLTKVIYDSSNGFPESISFSLSSSQISFTLEVDYTF